ncbi:MAG: hypothetical protein NWF07_05540, partial [Candidatus Bathyarchaeota archaeon]|nr:hypothetical protein [Candidatus Bathyarchaeota archaeon]
VYLLKTDADGNEIWTKTYGGGYGRSVIQTDDGGYAVAAQEYFVKTDTDGTLDWKKLRSLPVYPTWKILDAHVYSLVQTSDGGYIGVGYCEYQINSGPDAGTYGGLYVTKIDADGDAEWVIKRPDIVGEVIIKTSDNRYVISCYASIMKIDANGNEIWFMKFGPTYDYRWSVIQTSANEYIMAGKENNDMFIIKTKITPIRIINDRPNPGTVYFESNTSWSDSVRFYIILSDMNKTRGRSNFQLTIIDSNQTVVFSKTFSIRHRTNWYVFNLNPKWFKEGEYTANAVAETWNTTKTIQIN